MDLIKGLYLDFKTPGPPWKKSKQFLIFWLIGFIPVLVGLVLIIVGMLQ